MKFGVVGALGFGQLKEMADLVRDAPDAAKRAGFRAVNAVGAKVITRAKREIAATVNLPVSFVGDQMNLRKAGPERADALITARFRAVRLMRFGARQRTVKAKIPRRSKGDSLRKIAQGRKQAGVSVKVLRAGRRKTMRGAFLVPLRAGKAASENGMGVFVRTGAGLKDIEHKYGPSPHQLFRTWREKNLELVQEMLTTAYREQLRFELTGSRK